MNAIPIQRPPNPPRVSRKQEISGGEQAEFLALRLLHKRNRVQLSRSFADISGWPNRLNLFSIASRKGWFVVGAKPSSGPTYQLQFSPISDLRNRFASEEKSENERFSFSFKRILPIAPYTPIILRFAHLDERLVAASAEGVVAVFDSAQLFSEGSNQVAPLHVFEGLPIKDVQSNPGDTPHIVAVMRGDRPNSYIEIIDVQAMSVICTWSSTANACATSLSWSLKGKQLAIGLSNGDIVTYSPAEPTAPKFFFPAPQVSGSWAAVGLSWISKTLFYLILADNSGSTTENMHFICSHDANGPIVEMKMDPSPCPPFGAMRPSGPQTLTLRDWAPFKSLILLGDGPSSEMALVGNAENKWFPILVDESSIPNLPLDEDMNDTAVLGFDIDLTSTIPLTSANEESTKPPAPILYLYASDGTVVARHIVNDQGPYPGMLSTPPPVNRPAVSANSFAASTGPRPPVSVFGLRPSQTDVMQDDPPTPPTPKDRDMDEPPFGGLSLGGSTSNQALNSNKGNPMFGGGSFSNSGFGSGGASSFFKPANSAFGSAVNTGDSNPFAAPKSTEKSPLTFGASGFRASQPTKGFSSSVQSPSGPTFGSSGFGARAPAFGSSSFGQTTKAVPPQGSGAGFGAFASKETGFGSFAAASPASGGSIFGSVNSASQSGDTGNTPADPATSKQIGFGAFASGGGGFGSVAKTSAPSIFSSSPGDAKPTIDASIPKSAFPASTAFSTFGSKGSPFSTSVENKAESQVPSFALPKSPTSPSPTFKQVQVSSPSTTPAKTQRSEVDQKTPSDSPFRAGTGFGAFGVMKTSSVTSSFNTPSQSVTQPSSFVSAFGASGGPKNSTESTNSQTTSAPTFGQSSFGQTSFGKTAPSPGFSTSTFGSKSNSFASTDSPFKASSAFSAFSGGSGAFTAKPSKKSTEPEVKTEATPPSSETSPLRPQETLQISGLPTRASEKPREADAKVDTIAPTPEVSPLRPKETLKTPSDPAIKPITTSSPPTKAQPTAPKSPESPFEKVDKESNLGSSFASVLLSEEPESPSGEEGEEAPASPDDNEGSEYIPSRSNSSTETPESDGDLDSLLEDRESTPTVAPLKRTSARANEKAGEKGPESLPKTEAKPATKKALTPTTSSSKPATGFNWAAAGLKPPVAGPSWTCSTCMISNPESAVKCGACEAPAPHAVSKKIDQPKLTMPAPPTSFKTNIFASATENAAQSTPAGTSGVSEGRTSPFGFGFGLGRPSSRPTKSSPLAQTLGAEKRSEVPATSSSSPTGPKPFTMPIPPSGGFQNFGLGKMQGDSGNQSPSSGTGMANQRKPFFPQFQPPAPVEPENRPVIPPVVQPVETGLEKALSKACQGTQDEFERLRIKFLEIQARHASSNHGESRDPELPKSLQFVKEGLFELQLGLREKESMFNDLESDLLKQQVQMQHIKLLSAAVKDSSFKAMAESRPLDPDQVEKREHLRRASKECESLLAQIESKVGKIRKGLEAQRNGRINLKTPSLASIDNTCIMLEANITAQNKRFDVVSRQLKANPLPTSAKYAIRRSSEVILEAQQGSSDAAAKRATAILEAQRAKHHLRMNLLSVMKQPLLTTRVMTLEEADKNRNAFAPTFGRIKETKSPSESQTLPAVPLTPVTLASVPPSGSWALPPLQTDPTTPTPSPHNTAGHHGSGRRIHTAARVTAAQLPAPASSPKTPPTYAPPSNFSWGALPHTTTPSPSPSPHIKFGATTDLRPKGGR